MLRFAVADPQAGARVLREARVIARLEHPGIVPVHDSGVLPDGRIYYTMKLVRGQRLDEHVGQAGSLSERLRVFQKICDAVAFAHAHGVIHRDLKPENIMVGPFGEVLVMDWGVAKLLAEPPEHVIVARAELCNGVAGAEPPIPKPASADASSVDQSSPPPGREHSPGAQPIHSAAGTADGTVIGTPGYMSPEQARGEVERIDERSDVYALGAILQFLLTGKPGEAASRHRPQTPRALLAVCAKALASEPNHRYQTVRELAAEIERFLADLRVDAFSEGLLDRAKRLAWKYRTPILLVLAYLAMRIALIFLSRG